MLLTSLGFLTFRGFLYLSLGSRNEHQPSQEARLSNIHHPHSTSSDGIMR
jgi:hypothetical protein